MKGLQSQMVTVDGEQIFCSHFFSFRIFLRIEKEGEVAEKRARGDECS